MRKVISVSFLHATGYVTHQFVFTIGLLVLLLSCGDSLHMKAPTCKIGYLYTLLRT